MSSKDHISSVGLFSMTSSMCVFIAHPGLKGCCCLATQDVQMGCLGQLQCNILQCLQHRCTTEDIFGCSYILNCDYRLEYPHLELQVVIILVSPQAGFK